MENVYLLDLITSMERELEAHQQGKYADSEKHADCPRRLGITIDSLKAQLHEWQQLSAEKTSQANSAESCSPCSESKSKKKELESKISSAVKSGSKSQLDCAEAPQTVRGEELESVHVLERLAAELDKLGICEEAEFARNHARELLALQLNELDGFGYGTPENLR